MDDSNLNIEKECGICHEEYDKESHCPRCLPCGHNLCTHCICVLIQRNSKCCPFCRQDFNGDSEEDLETDHRILAFLGLVPSSEVEPTLLAKATTSSSSWLNAFRKSNEVIYKENISLLKHNEEKLNNGMQMNNTLLGKLRDELSKINEISSLYQNGIKYLEEANHFMKQELKLVEDSQHCLEKVREQLNSATSFKDAGTVMDEADIVNSRVSSWGDHMKQFLENDTVTQQQIEKALQANEEKSNHMQENASYLRNLTMPRLPGGNTVPLHSNPHMLQRCDLKITDSSVRVHLEKNEIWAVWEKGLKKRFAMLSIRANKKTQIAMHSLVDTPLPNVQLLKHSDCQLMFSSTKLAFLLFTASWISRDNHPHSRTALIHIHFPEESKRARQFAHLCMGDLGPSYKNTRSISFPDLKTGMERIVFGDYEYNNGDGGKALIPRVHEEAKGKREQTWTAGAVVLNNAMNNTAAQFYIRTCSVHGLECEESFGIVTEGLSDLKALMKLTHYNRFNIVISDCGVILSS